jgi:hypothetical protein
LQIGMKTVGNAAPYAAASIARSTLVTAARLLQPLPLPVRDSTEPVFVDLSFDHRHRLNIPPRRDVSGA